MTSADRASTGTRRARQAIGLGRAAFGVALLAAPARPGKAWFGAEPDRAATTALLRSVGGRDIALGVGVALAPVPGPWLQAAALADVVDAAGMLASGSGIPRRFLVRGVATALVFAAAGLALERASA